jgi:RNA polymerase primary sigma factor
MKQLKISNSITNRDNESFKLYLKEVSEIEVFATPEDEYKCAMKAASGDKKAVQELVRRNLRFVISVAKQYATEDLLLIDLVNEGNIGLIMAAEKFTPEKGYKFISYAVWYIRKLILEYINKNGKMVRIPANKINALSKIQKKVHELEQIKGRNVDFIEVLEVYGHEINDDDFKFLDVLNDYNMDSLDRQVSAGDDGGSALGDLIADTSMKNTDHLVDKVDFKGEFDKILDDLKPRDKQIIQHLFGLNGFEVKSLKEIGEDFSISREMARQIKEKTLRKLRQNPKAKKLFAEMG